MNSPVVIMPTMRHSATIFFFHGLGDTGHGWAAALSEINLPFLKVVCPTAPLMKVTLNQGIEMPSWFDLKTLDPFGEEDVEGIKHTSQLVHQMIDAEIKSGISNNQIALGGFSQGGALAIYSSLRYSKPLASIIGLSCWLPLHKNFPKEAIGNLNTPLLQCHGDCDPVVPFQFGQQTASLLKTFMTATQFKIYKNMMHSTCDEELKEVKVFLSSHLGSQ